MKKKVVSMLLAAVVAIGAAGCGSDANTSTKTEGQADAALAASLFHYKELEIKDLKSYLYDRGVSVRT